MGFHLSLHGAYPGDMTIAGLGCDQRRTDFASLAPLNHKDYFAF